MNIWPTLFVLLLISFVFFVSYQIGRMSVIFKQLKDEIKNNIRNGQISLTEGPVKKGGVNNSPYTPRPPVVPSGQGKK